METVMWALSMMGLGILGILWLYVAARVVTRGVMRSIRKKQEEEEREL